MKYIFCFLIYCDYYYYIIIIIIIIISIIFIIPITCIILLIPVMIITYLILSHCDTVDGCEILHQLKMLVYPIIYGVSSIQGGAGFRNHPPY
jgi:hypothetical protein